jgi:3-methyladenine DNA glycosylase AlkD
LPGVAMTAQKARSHLRKIANTKTAARSKTFFKTKPGQYAAEDIFIGINVPTLRQAAQLFADLPLSEIDELLQSPIHEDRYLALMILTNQYHKSDAKGRQKIFNHYLRRRKFVNQWDLVDASAAGIVGAHLLDRDKAELYRLIQSPRWWERRIAVVATNYFINRNKFDVTLDLATRLLDDPHDLMHKAVGWMLREVGKRDEKVLQSFLRKHGSRMPRTMLRYAIERFPPSHRKRYLAM